MGEIAFRYPIILIIIVSVALLLMLLAFIFPRKLGHRVPVAYSERLTDLPGYKKMRLALFFINIISIAIVTTLITILTFLSARPSKHIVLRGNDPFKSRNEIMLCTNRPLDDIYTEAFLHYFIAPANNEKNMIGLTSKTTRVLPLTNQFWFSSVQLNFFASIEEKVLNSQQKGKDFGFISDDVYQAQDIFERKIRYSDYAPNYIDNLALCLAGFPEQATEKSPVVRSILFFGDPTTTTPDKQIFTVQQMIATAHNNNVSINIAMLDKQTDNTMRDFRTVTQQTGGSIIDCNYRALRNITASDISKANNIIGTKISALYSNLDKAPTEFNTKRNYIIRTDTVDNPQTLLTIAAVCALLLALGFIWVKE